MEKGRGKGTDTLQTDKVFTRKEYIEREAAYKFMFDIPNPNGAGEIEVVSVDDLESIPAADVVPVVRCKDCKHSAHDWQGNRYCGLVKTYNTVDDDWFCADGERKDGDGE